jgi:hypothetical protein
MKTNISPVMPKKPIFNSIQLNLDQFNYSTKMLAVSNLKSFAEDKSTKYCKQLK